MMQPMPVLFIRFVNCFFNKNISRCWLMRFEMDWDSLSRSHDVDLAFVNVFLNPLIVSAPNCDMFLKRTSSDSDSCLEMDDFLLL